MVVNRGRSLLIAGLLGVIGWNSALQAASSLTAEQNRLARMEQVQENRLVELEDIENEMLAYEYKLQRAQESLSKARENYQQSLVELKTAEREHKGAPSTDTERALHKARHAHDMAERGVDSRNRRVEIIQSNFAELEQRLKDSRESVAAGKARLASQQTLVDSLVNAMLSEANTKAQAKKVEQAKSASPAVAMSQPEIPEPTLASLAPAEEAAPAAAEAAVAQEPVREIDPELLEYVRGERERLEKLLGELEEGEEGKHTFRNLTLRPSGEDSIEFEFLGQNQYKLIAPVSSGRQTYKINSWRFRRTIPSDDDGERYVFIFDARRLSRPRLVMYPEYVLSHLD